MRHRVDHRKLNRTAAHRRAMLRNMVTSLFDKERITTTDAKAKEARRLAERLITRARKGHVAHQEGLSLKQSGKEEEAREMEAVALAHWRQAGRHVKKMTVLKKLFDVIAPQFMDREGGYTRILHTGTRQGDNAKTVLLELIGTEVTVEPVRKKGRKKAEEAGEEVADVAEEKQAKPKKEKKEKREAKTAEKAEAVESADSGSEKKKGQDKGSKKKKKSDS